jgi:predicted Zn-dependent peptidase
MTERLRAHCGDWKRTGAARTHAAVPHAVRRFAMQLPTVHRHYALMVSPAPALQDPRRHAAAMLAQILGDQEGSRLYWSLVETGLAEDAVAQYEGRDGLGEYIVYCVCSPDDAERVTEIARKEMAGLAASLTEDDLLRTRRKIATAATISGELPAGRMRRLGRLWTALGEYRSLEDEIARIESVTLDELREVAETFPITDLVHGSLSPGA